MKRQHQQHGAEETEWKQKNQPENKAQSEDADIRQKKRNERTPGTRANRK